MATNILKLAEVDFIWAAIYLGMITSVLVVFLILYGFYKGH